MAKPSGTGREDPTTIAPAVAAAFIEGVVAELASGARAKPFVPNREWASGFPDKGGVYAIFQSGEIIYVGETGLLSERMIDLLESRHHCFRRSFGQSLFSTRPDFVAASTKKRFPDAIETLLNERMSADLMVTCVPLVIGRKEVEEAVIASRKPTFNIKQGRGN